MTTPLSTTEAPHAATAPDAPRRRRPAWFRPAIAAAGVAAIAVAAVAAVNVIGDDGDDAPVASGPPLELALDGSSALASCLPFEVAILADMSPAFAATATEVVPGQVTLDVDRWYAGGDAETVVLTTLDSSPALIDGFEFVAGEQYLITAAEGTVNFCGYSGPATPELTAAFDAAFAG